MTKKAKHRPLTPKQQKFVDCYDGNATQAAIDAGYKGSYNTLKVVGSENLAKPYILNAIIAREKPGRDAKIATRQERQEFWTEAQRNAELDIKDRFKASELLGRSQADFTDKHEHTGKNGEPIPIQVLTTIPEPDPPIDTDT